MNRRDLSKALFVSVAGSTLVAQHASAQACTPPCYPQTAEESTAGVVPVNTTYPPCNVLRYGTNASPGGTDMTAAIRNANAVATVAKTKVFFPSGTYFYKPTNYLEISHAWEGESVESTVILCSTANYTGEFFRVVGSCEIRNLFFKNNGLTKNGTAIRVTGANPTDFTGHLRLTRVWVQGFGNNIQIDRSFLVTLDQVRSEYGSTGFYCEPGTAAPGPDAYVTTHMHINCYYAFNNVNVFYRTDIASTNVTFIGGANEAAQSTSYSAYFGNIANLRFIDWYCENQTAPVVISAAGRNVTFDGLYLNNTGGIFLGGNVQARFTSVRTTSATDVLAGGDGTQIVSMEGCSWQISGNSTHFKSLIMLQTYFNGKYYDMSLPSIRSGSGSPQGIVIAPVGTLYLRSDGGAGTTLYVKEAGSGNTGWVGKK
jgi:hypothetical protein